LFKNKEFNKAIHTEEQTFDLASLVNNAPLQISLFHNLGKVVFQTGKIKNALEYFEKGMELSKKTFKSHLIGCKSYRQWPGSPEVFIKCFGGGSQS
jgi:hypothetical protein